MDFNDMEWHNRERAHLFPPCQAGVPEAPAFLSADEREEIAELWRMLGVVEQPTDRHPLGDGVVTMDVYRRLSLRFARAEEGRLRTYRNFVKLIWFCTAGWCGLAGIILWLVTR